MHKERAFNCIWSLDINRWSQSNRCSRLYHMERKKLDKIRINSHRKHLCPWFLERDGTGLSTTSGNVPLQVACSPRGFLTRRNHSRESSAVPACIHVHPTTSSTPPWNGRANSKTEACWGSIHFPPPGKKKKAFISPPVTQPCPLKRRNHSNRHAVNRLNTSVRYMRVSYSTPT